MERYCITPHARLEPFMRESLDSLLLFYCIIFGAGSGRKIHRVRIYIDSNSNLIDKRNRIRISRGRFVRTHEFISKPFFFLVVVHFGRKKFRLSEASFRFYCCPSVFTQRFFCNSGHVFKNRCWCRLLQSHEHAG
jgi:hypothetical protein